MQEILNRRTNKERSETMRAALVASARKLFVEKGYSDTGTPEIVSAAKVTRGALYHHFENKTDLFHAVVVEEAIAVSMYIKKRTKESTSASDALQKGSVAYFTAMRIPGRVRLLLLDGPSILGPGEMRNIDNNIGGNLLREGFMAVVGEKENADQTAAIAEMLSACFDRAALAIASGQPERVFIKAIQRILSSVV